jgi:hypothetical protein
VARESVNNYIQRRSVLNLIEANLLRIGKLCKLVPELINYLRHEKEGCSSPPGLVH